MTPETQKGGGHTPMPGDTTPGWTTAEEALNARRAYEDALLHRYHNHMQISRFDRAEARRIIRERAASTKLDGAK